MSYKPNRGKSYWMINSRFQVKQTENTGSQKSADRINAGNAFKTQAEAEAFREQITLFAQKGIYRTGQYQPQYGIVTKILTWLTYLLLIALVVAAICLVIDFIFWIYDIHVTLPAWLKA